MPLETSKKPFLDGGSLIQSTLTHTSFTSFTLEVGDVVLEVPARVALGLSSDVIGKNTCRNEVHAVRMAALLLLEVP